MTKLKQLLQEIESARRRHDLFGRKDSLLVGLSGGPDSTALLELLSKMKKKYSLKLTAAHLNHGLSKKEGTAYRRLAQTTCERLRIPLYSKQINLKKLSKKSKRSLEETGRIERYRFFTETARRCGAHKIVTAHTVDDQAETMLMRIIRGSGLRGLAGIPAKRKEGAFQVIRPLLNSQKNDILRFLKDNQIPFCIDKSNLQTVFTRNKIRRVLLPQLERLFNPQIKQTLASLQAVSCELQDYLDPVVSQAMKNCRAQQTPKKISLRLERLRRLHPAICSQVLLSACEKVKGDTKRIGHSHVAAILDLLKSEENRLETHLPGGIEACKENGFLSISVSRSSPPVFH